MKKRYIVPSAVMLAASVFGGVAFGTQDTYAEELPHCAGIKKFEKWDESDEYDLVFSPISINSDTIVSFEIPDQTTRCKFELNINGHVIAQAYATSYTMSRPNIKIGKNVEAIVNGNGGSIVYGTPEPRPCEITDEGEVCYMTEPRFTGAYTNSIIVDANSKLTIKNINSIETNHDSGYAIENSGTVIADNVNTNSYMHNNGGSMTLTGGSYGKDILVENGSNTVLNGGTYKNILIESNKVKGISKVVINGGTFSNKSIEVKSNFCPLNQTAPCLDAPMPSDGYDRNLLITPESLIINDGTFNGTKILGSATINGGSFDSVKLGDGNGGVLAEDNSILSRPIVNINGGSFNGTDMTGMVVNVSGGTFDQTAVLSGGTLNVSGGQLTNTMVASGAIMNTTGGTLNIVGVLDDGTLNVNGGTFNGVQAYGDTYGIIVDDDGAVNVSNGTIAKIDVIDGTVNISGGRVENINAEDDGEVNITGGRIGALNVPNSNLNIYGGTFSAVPNPDIIPDDAVVTQNSNGTYTVTSSASTNHPEDILDDVDDDVVGVPDTGAMFQFETSGKIALSVAAVLAGIVVFAKLGGYAHERARAKRVIDFDK